MPAPELLDVLMLPDLEWADRIGEFWSYPESRTFAELLIQTIWDRRRRRGARPNGPTRQRGIESDSESVQGPGAPVLSLLTRERTGTGTPEADFLPRGFLHFLGNFSRFWVIPSAARPNCSTS